MKHLVGTLTALILALAFFNATPARAVDLNNFRISSYDISYELSRNDEHRSTLWTEETITAEFPTYDQNHGLERLLATSYDGHSTNLHIISVTDAAGNALPYSTANGDGVQRLRIGSADTYVRGTQTYKITYTQQDVTHHYADTGRDEWYWDTNGTDWQVPIDSLTITAKVDDSLKGAIASDMQCYAGTFGSADKCAIKQNEDGSYGATLTNLVVGENATLALGFTEGTFTEYKMSPFEIAFGIWWMVQVVMIGVSAFLAALMIYLLARRYNRSKELHPIVVEYIPPRDVSVSLAASVSSKGGTQKVFAAQLIDLAVRRYIGIIETRPKSRFKAAQYDIQVLADMATLSAEEQELVSDIFGHTPQVGERIAMESLKNDMAYTRRLMDNDTKLAKLAVAKYGMRAQSVETRRYFKRWALAILAISILTLTVYLPILALITYLIGRFMAPLTDKGLAVRRYVMGLDKYIAAAEEERLKFLQGPDTAQKVGFAVDVNDHSQLVKLYERTLPYAVLFGREEEWGKRIGEFYQEMNTNPTWYSGSSSFQAASLGAALSGFSQSASAVSRTVDTSSSSSGGSGGGGFSGGGGGGGGGGGW